MFYKGEGVLPYMAYSGQPPGKSALGTRLYAGISAATVFSAAGPLCPKKIYNFAGVCQWGIASGIACTIDLICYLNFFYLYFNYKNAMTIT